MSYALSWKQEKHAKKDERYGQMERTRFSYGTLHESMKVMFTDPVACDISFICHPPDGVREVVRAHKFVLLARSPVFRAMFSGPLGLQTSEIEILDTSADDFRELLRYLYYEEAVITEENVIYILYNAHKYMMPSLADKCVEFAKRVLDVGNVCQLYEISKLYNACELQEQCEQLIKQNIVKIIEQGAFRDIAHETVMDFLGLKFLNIAEADLVQAVTAWAEEECLRRHLELSAENKRLVLGDIIYSLRLPTLTLEELQDVFTSDILSSKEISAITSYKETGDSSNLTFRVDKRRRNSGLRSKVDILEKSCCSVIFAGKWNETDIEVSDDIMLLGIDVMDMAPTSHTVRVTAQVTQNDEILCRFGINMQHGRRLEKFGAVCTISFPNPARIRRGSFKIQTSYRFIGGQYGTVPLGLPKAEHIDCDGITLTFDPNKSCHISAISFCPV